MKIALFVPRYEQQRGNTVTVNRIAKGLSMQGVETEIINTTAEGSSAIPVHADLYHGFHAYRFSQFRKKATYSLTPYVVTMTGTDVNHDLFDKNRKKQVIDTLKEAKAIHVFTKEAKSIVSERLPSQEENIFVIPQAVTPFAVTESKFQKEAGTFLFILPAGLRKVKNIPQAIHVLASIKTHFPQVRLWLVGP